MLSNESMNPGRHKLQGAGFVPGGLGDERDVQINVQFFIGKCAVGNHPRGHYRYFTDLSASIMDWDVTYQKYDVTRTINCARVARIGFSRMQIARNTSTHHET